MESRLKVCFSTNIGATLTNANSDPPANIGFVTVSFPLYNVKSGIVTRINPLVNTVSRVVLESSEERRSDIFEN